MDKSKLFREQNQQLSCGHVRLRRLPRILHRFNSTTIFPTPVVSNDCDPTRAARILFFFKDFFWKLFQRGFFCVGLPTAVVLTPVACSRSGNKDTGGAFLEMVIRVPSWYISPCGWWQSEELVGRNLNLLPLGPLMIRNTSLALA